MIILSEPICPEMKKLQDEELNHKPEYTQDIPEEALDRMTNSEVEGYYTDKDKEWQKEFDRRFKAHLLNCDHVHCTRIRKNWKDDGLL